MLQKRRIGFWVTLKLILCSDPPHDRQRREIWTAITDLIWEMQRALSPI